MRCGADSGLGTTCELPVGHEGAHVSGFVGTLAGGPSWLRERGACTPRCADLHAIDCPNYRGPLSATGSLSKPEPGDVAMPGW